ncbi:hypothetical protein I79_012585 [Cricetulus griseus]|uniref:Uncharacterized protein n=1 Tax=Cricetulus griseus TaxID=10029 RepID=G3HP79_CRIGR|nr:hypothetical protein I79_012585 [Cricetulus griseus]
MLRNKKLAHFPVQFKELFAVSAGVIGYIVGPCDNIQRPILPTYKILPQKVKGEIPIIPEQKGERSLSLVNRSHCS